MSYFAQYSYLRQLSFHADRYVCFYIQMNSGRYFKISYLLWATDYPRQWSDFICWSILSVQSHKTSNYRICFYYLESWRLRSQLQLYDGKNTLTEKKKKNGSINNVMAKLLQSAAELYRTRVQRDNSPRMKKSYNTTQDHDTGLLRSEYRVVNSPLTL